MTKLVRFGKRGWFLVGLALLTVPLVTAAVAYGCTALARLAVAPGAGAPGSVVTVNGEGFGTHDPSLASSNGPAEIRLGSATGQVLATAAPSGTNRAFSVPITVPAVAPGDTVLVATQKTSSGTNVFGTPARTVFTVTAPPPPPGGSSSGLTSSGQTVSAPQVVNTTGSSNNTAASRAAKRAKAVAACKKKYNPSKAKSRRGKRSVARKRASCISKANKL